jgi:tetratricopeptide (TPR) repeat protein
MLACVALGCAASSPAADIEEAEQLFRKGRYDECARLAAGEIRGNIWDEPWSLLKIRAELARGETGAAMETFERGLRSSPASLPLRLLGLEVYRAHGRDAESEAAADEIEAMVLSAPRRFTSPESRVALGRFLLMRKYDARKVLDQFYDVATKQDPDYVEGHLAKAELALEKEDNALAAETLQAAPRAAAEDPRYHFLLARAFSDGERARAAESLKKALEINPNHADSLLLSADHLIDAEQHDEAAKTLDRVLAVNPHEPRAWAYQAVLAHLRNDPKGEASARASALARRAANPEVDHLIGRKLSQKYRFAEGSAYQRRAIETDPDYLPAKVQLCQDLLRLGEEDEGWRLADEVFAADGYNVVAFNLTTLRDHLSGFRTLEAEGLVVRMDPREADLYGARVLDLLGRARKALCEKYGVAIERPVIVEIFPQKKDFAVRTFGLPGADGLLGVCFGRVITANSPASQGEDPANWESVLWHEFCHVVTLHATRNKMPRWLSEGISVYEEERQDPAWGTPMNPRFREMVLGDELTPLSRLSSAFLAPESPLHLQFAYFESALAVDFLNQRFGLAAVRGLLDDLGAGMTIQESLPARSKMTLEQLDEEFVRFARLRARSVAPEATWDEPDLPEDAPSEALAAWVAGHPKGFHGLRRLGARLVAEEKWEQAEATLKSLKDLYPEYVGADNAYAQLAAVYRRRGDAEAERAILEELAARDASAGQAFLRLMELDEAEQDWTGLAKDARRLLAVNPLIPAPHRQLALASERLGERDSAVEAYRALSLLDDTDPAGVHYRLASLLKQAGESAEARREVLKALEEAPRFLDAHRLLLELVEGDPGAPAPRQADSAP